MIITNSFNEYLDIDLRVGDDFVLPLVLFENNLLARISSNSGKLTQGYLTSFHLLPDEDTLDIDSYIIYSKSKLIRVNKFDSQYLLRFTPKYSAKYSIIIKEVVLDMPISSETSNSHSAPTYTKNTVSLTTANTPVLIAAADSNRRGISLVTRSGGTWYFGCVQATSVSNYIYKTTTTGTLIEWLPSDYTGEIWGVCSLANASVDTMTYS